MHLSKIPLAPRLKRHSSSFPIKTYLLALSFKALLVQPFGLLRYEMIRLFQSSFPTSMVMFLILSPQFQSFHPRVVYNLTPPGPFYWPHGFLLRVYGVKYTLGTLVVTVGQALNMGLIEHFHTYIVP
jgi:hypothetical protein